MPASGHQFDPVILREYDIRGIVGESLTAMDALAVGRTLGTIVARGGGRSVAIAYDGRTTSPELEAALVDGISACGLMVRRIGLAPTPAMYFATKVLDVDAGVMVTGSHNPSNYNGFKINLGGRPFWGQDIQCFGEAAARGDWIDGDGSVEDVDVRKEYIAKLRSGYNGRRDLTVVWDPGNGAAGEIVADLVERLPGRHIVINAVIDGTFPAHHPDPTVEANLAQLKDAVQENGAELGVAFDGDGDRLGAIDGRGRVLWGDQLLALLARDVLARHPGAPILADVKASQMLFDEVARLGGQPVMCPTGHSIIKDRMARLNAPLAGEMSGHLFFADGYFGYDDAVYAAVRLLNLVASSDATLAELRDQLPAMVNTPEIRIDADEARKFKIVEEVKSRLADMAGRSVNDTDGVRVTTDDGWWLLRASNTQSSLVLRCEAGDEAALERLKSEIREQLSMSGVALPEF
ncbi:MAG: phosphomannomutase/phosphoglucomutase [Rhodospirillales bacterium]|nr:MAG: phosphomannomutase/phosphoglucomutase [Rhodospirillales bacterium]